MKTVVTSGYFNPLHIGHLSLLTAAKKLGDRLVVIVNNDWQVELKGSVPFMNAVHRAAIVSALRCVDEVVISTDMGRSVINTLNGIEFDIFAKGGDSTPSNTPEERYCLENGKEIMYRVGGDKIESSSHLIKMAQV